VESLWVSLRHSLWGQHEQYWIGYYRFMELYLGVKYAPQDSERLGWWQDIAESANWWFPYDGVCLISERPTVCTLDDDRRLHNETGPAMAYADGWAVHAWHGVRVPSFVIEHPETITAQHIRDEQNAEVRRVMLEQMGWEKFCASANMRVLHEDHLETRFSTIPVSELVEPGTRLITSYRPGKETAQLLEAEDLADYEERPLRFVRLTDPSTGRQYVIRVRHDHTRCYEAVAWTFGLTEEEYKNRPYLRQGDVLLKPLTDHEMQQQHS
jgi:hypothetical protein